MLKFERTRIVNKIIKDEKAFTLIDTAIALMLIGLLVAPAFFQLKIQKKKEFSDRTEANIRIIEAAMERYFIDNDFYPCPANPALAYNAATHGDAVTDGAGSCTILNAAGVAEGTIPHAEIGIDIDEAYDAWGSKITYAVDPSRASRRADGVPPAGANIPLRIEEVPEIQLVINAACDETTVCANSVAAYPPPVPGGCFPSEPYPTGLNGRRAETTNGVHYTLFSPGEDARGGFTRAGVPVPGPACNTTLTLSDENCDGDNIYATRQCVNNDTNTANFYDDYFVARASEKTNNPVELISNSRNSATGKKMGASYVGIRNDDPQFELDILGNLKATGDIADPTKEGAARAGDYCSETGAECFDAELIGGTKLSSPCPSGQTMVGIGNNNARCERILTDNIPTTNCANGISQISIPSSGTGSISCL